MLQKFKQDRSGVLFVYMVLFIALIAGVFFAFLMMNLVEAIQDAINPLTQTSQWATGEHYTAYYYASLLLTNVWTYIIAFVFFIVMFWAWIYSQRKGAGYS